MSRWRFWTVGAIIVLATATIITLFVWKVGEVRGTITENGEPLAGATVSVKATGFQTTTDARGEFVLNDFPPEFSVHLTAWKDGYYIGGKTATPFQHRVAIEIGPYRTEDNPDYEWVVPKIERPALNDFFTSSGLYLAKQLSFEKLFLPLASRLKLGCADCHPGIYDQWNADAHSQGTSNIRFMTMYNGTDVNGRQSPLARYGHSRDYGAFPLRPEPDEAYFGPGFKLDFPDQPGNCANCHAPAAALADSGGADMNETSGFDSRGSQCDFCHKIAAVSTDPATRLPGENMPGVISMELRRPEGEPQLFFGPYDDVDISGDTRLPLVDESLFCAACHNASFWGTPVYQSYAEWLSSPYPDEGKTCQSCHMQPDGETENFAPNRGGVKRDPQTIYSHTFAGAADTDLLQNTAEQEISATRKGDIIDLEVRVTNANAGHDMPTDHPMRNIILVVSATGDGGELEMLSGPVVPEWGGRGEGETDYAGRPGRGYAKVLEELWTEVSPTAAYWRQTRVREDTRIKARETDVSRYEFRVPQDSAQVRIEARLVFRRAFRELAARKGWTDADILMEQAELTLP